MKKLLLFSFLFIIAKLPAGDLDKNYRLPEDIIPELGCWFWQKPEFEPQDYKVFIDLAANHAPYKILTTSIRFPDKELTDAPLHNRIKSPAQNAESKNISIVMDLDVRLARQAFYKKYPYEMQQMVILKEIDLSSDENIDAVIQSFDLSDHYTFRTIHYIPLSGSFLRAYSYSLTADGISSESLKDISKECIVLTADKDSVYVRIQPNQRRVNRKV